MFDLWFQRAGDHHGGLARQLEKEAENTSPQPQARSRELTGSRVRLPTRIATTSDRLYQGQPPKPPQAVPPTGNCVFKHQRP